MKLFLFIPLMVFLFSCGQSKKINETSASTNSGAQRAANAIDFDATIGEFKTSDAIQITKATISYNTLFLTISYSGGCENHSFELIGSPMITKSLPPGRAIQIVHDAKNDSCEALITKKLAINISELAYIKSPGSEIFLSIDGWDEKMKYTYE